MKLTEQSQNTVMDPFRRLLRLRAGAGVKRYHTFPTLGDQLVGQHSHAVVLFLMSYCTCLSGQLLKAAIAHDLAEYDTGDTPANVKWSYPTLARILSDAEGTIDEWLGIGFSLTQDERLWLQLADTTEYLLYSMEQRLLGNMNMDVVFARGIGRLKNYALALEPDIQKFILELQTAYGRACSGCSPTSLAVEVEK